MFSNSEANTKTIKSIFLRFQCVVVLIILTHFCNLSFFCLCRKTPALYRGLITPAVDLLVLPDVGDRAVSVTLLGSPSWHRICLRCFPEVTRKNLNTRSHWNYSKYDIQSTSGAFYLGESKWLIRHEAVNLWDAPGSSERGSSFASDCHIRFSN